MWCEGLAKGFVSVVSEVIGQPPDNYVPDTITECVARKTYEHPVITFGP